MKNGGFVCSARFFKRRSAESLSILQEMEAAMPKITETITTNLFAFLLIVMFTFQI
jgi:hypothetical protein